VPYTVWSNDRLVGETDLDYIANTSEAKMGDFVATEFGDEIISVLMAPRKAVCAHAALEEVEALYTQRETIPLELRAPGGRVIPTDDIEITDLDWLLSLASADLQDNGWEPDLDAALEAERVDELDQLLDEFDVPEVEMSELELPEPSASQPVYPRYQIQVRIKGGG
jgi:hypothetical protein